MTDDADAHALEIGFQTLAIERHRAIGTSGVVRVVPGDRLQEQGAIFGRPGDRPAMIEAVRVRDDAAPAHAAVCRFEAGDPAERRRYAHRSSGVGSERRRDESRRDSRTRTAARSAGEAREIPRGSRRWPWQSEGRTAVGEFVRRELADEHCACSIELLHDRRIVPGNVSFEEARMSRRAYAGGLDYVLQPDRNAVERAAITARCALAVAVRRLLLRKCGCHGDERIHLTIV